MKKCGIWFLLAILFLASCGKEDGPAAFEGLTPGMTAEEVEEAWGISFADSLIPGEDGNSESCALKDVTLPESGFVVGDLALLFMEDFRAADLPPGLRLARVFFSEMAQTEAFYAHLDSLYGEAKERMIGESGLYYFWGDPDVTIRYNSPETFLGRMNPAGVGYFEIIFDYPHIPTYLV